MIRRTLATALAAAALTAAGLGATGSLAFYYPPPSCDPAACAKPSQAEREQNARIARLEWQVKLLRIRVDTLEARVACLERRPRC